MNLRPCQSAAIDAFIQWFADGKDRPLIVLPTGTGKSVVAAGICQRIKRDYPHVRIAIATHVKELVRQNHEKLEAVYPDAHAGIISAGLGRRDFYHDIIFCGIQSVYKNAVHLGHIDLLIIDEAHCIPVSGMGMWNRFISDLRAINPNLRVGGMTATPFRMTTGTLVGGSRPQFDGICYEYKITDAIKDGYLSEIVSAPVHTHLMTQGVHKRGGEYIESELQKAVDTDALTASCCEEIIALGADRKAWLIFAAGNSHAKHIHEYLQARGLHGYCVTQDQPGDRDKAVEELTNGQCRYVVNNMIFTTGFDCPRLDLIACLRPTQSAGLWVQICGRGTRLFSGKQNCLLLDFGRNIDRHGPIDQISGSEWFEKEKGEAPIKVCPQCMALVHASKMTCHDCGYQFPKPDLDITERASTGSVLSYQKAEPFDAQVIDMRISRHPGKFGKPDTMRVKYTTLAGEASEFICYDHPEQSYAYQQAVKWGGVFKSVSDAIEHEWQRPESVTLQKDGKYFKVIRRNFS